MIEFFETQTKLKTALGLIILGLIEGLLKVAFDKFPIIEVFSFQGLVGGWFMEKRQKTDVASMKYGNGNAEIAKID